MRYRKGRAVRQFPPSASTLALLLISVSRDVPLPVSLLVPGSPLPSFLLVDDVSAARVVAKITRFYIFDKYFQRRTFFKKGKSGLPSFVVEKAGLKKREVAWYFHGVSRGIDYLAPVEKNVLYAYLVNSFSSQNGDS